MGSFFLIVVCFLSGAAGAGIVSAKAVEWGLVDQPTGRSSHTFPTPRGGGVGILAAFLFAGLILDLPWWFVGPAFVLGGLSFFDDKMSLPVSARLLVQFVISGIMVFNMSGDWLTGGMGFAAVLVFLIIYLVAATNFYNFMDGINGIAGITGVVVFFLLGCFSFLRGDESSAWLFCFSLAMACLGFLPFNLPCAKVFMGDVGSVTLGLVSATLIVMLSRNPNDFLCLVSFLFLFYADTLTTLWFRWRAGERLSQAHRRHLYQVFANELGRPHWVVSLSYGLIQLIFGGIMLVAYYQGVIFQVATLFLGALAFVAITSRVRKDVALVVE